MNTNNKPVVGDLVTVKGNTYGYFKLHEMLPKGAHGRKCQLVKVLHSSTNQFDFALVKTFRYIDCKKVMP